MNDMKLIMENWRAYSKANSAPIALLSGDRSRVFNDPIDQLLFEHAMGNKKTEEVGLILERHIDTEYENLLKEGIIDQIKKGAGKVRDFAKRKLFTFMYGTTAKIIKFISSVTMKIITPYRKLLADIKSRAAEYLKSKEEQSKIIKILMSIARKVRTALAPIKAGAAKIGKIVYGKNTSLPAFKGCMMAVCASTLVLAMTCTGVFTGALAFAPLYAGKRIAGAVAGRAVRGAVGAGAKAAVGAGKKYLARKAAAAKAMAEQIIKEVATDLSEFVGLSQDVVEVAKGFLVQLIQSKGDDAVSETWTSMVDVGMADPSGVAGHTQFQGTGVQAYYAKETQDKTLDALFNALNSFDQVASRTKDAAGNIVHAAAYREEHPDDLFGAGWGYASADVTDPEARADFDSFFEGADETKKVIILVMRAAKAHCEADPTACEGASHFENAMGEWHRTLDAGEATMNETSIVTKSMERAVSMTDPATGEVRRMTADAGMDTYHSMEKLTDYAKEAAAKLPQLTPEESAKLADELGLKAKTPSYVQNIMFDKALYYQPDAEEKLGKLARQLGLDTRDKVSHYRFKRLMRGMGLNKDNAEDIYKQMVKIASASVEDAAKEKAGVQESILREVMAG